MNIEEIREYCISKEYAMESMPFGDDNIVFKVGTPEKAKMFALIMLKSNHYLILKCDPDMAIELRDKHSEIEGAFHMNKKHWNGIFTDGNLPKELIMEMIDNSYNLVVRRCGAAQAREANRLEKC